MTAPLTAQRKAPKRKTTGVILYEGPSMLDGAPIAVVATLRSSNVKTGDMVQTWIIRTDDHPTAIIKSGRVGSVCGGCPHRPDLGGACYVDVGKAPAAVWRAYVKGRYPYATDETLAPLAGRRIRFGAYGDPAAAPFSVWERLARLADAVTGYTHQASHPRFDPRLLRYCMVSADTPKQAQRQHAQGRRTFRVIAPGAPLLPGETLCPSETHGAQCIDCMKCDGGQGPSVAITVHGSKAGRYVERYGAANLIATDAA